MNLLANMIRTLLHLLASELFVPWSTAGAIIVAAIGAGWMANACIGAGKQSVVRPAVAAAILVALLAGLGRTAVFLAASRHLAYGLVPLAVESATTIVAVHLLSGAVTGLLVAFGLRVLDLVLMAANTGAEARAAWRTGAVPAVVVFALVGYYLNRDYLPRASDPVSLAVDGLLALACVPLALALGRLQLASHRMNAGLRFLARCVRPVQAAAGAGLVAVAAFWAAALWWIPAPAEKHRNLILISFDTLRADRLGAYGYMRPTPAFDRLAAESVLFTTLIANAPWTLPTHMSIFTGLYPGTHGVVQDDSRLPLHRVMFSELLQNAGYDTAAITDGGFTERIFGYQGFDYYDDSGSRDDRNTAEAMRRRAVAWLERQPTDRPFFLFLHTFQTHCPYDPTAEYDVYSDPHYAGPLDLRRKCAAYFEERIGRLGPEDLRLVSDKYDGLVRTADAALGRLLDDLGRLGIGDETVVVVTSDHGDNLGDHPRYSLGHGELYDEVVHVPLMIRLPGGPRGVRIGTQVEQVDLMPTILELLGVPIPVPIDGVSFAALLDGGQYAKTVAFSEDDRAGREESIRSPEWKLLRRLPANELELFELRSDPKEQTSVLAARPDAVEPLLAHLDRWSAERAAQAPERGGGHVEVDEALHERLRALGYVQ